MGIEGWKFGVIGFGILWKYGSFLGDNILVGYLYMGVDRHSKKGVWRNGNEEKQTIFDRGGYMEFRYKMVEGEMNVR
jgi:hypothetical protein